MDEAEKRRLKKLGKQRVEEQSRALQERLAEANPAPVGSKKWARNYKAQTLRERELRQGPPDRIAGAEAAREFVLNEVDPGPNFAGAPTWYVECPRCRDLVHTVPADFVACSCASIKLDPSTKRLTIPPGPPPRFVKLLARGEEARRKWWKFR